MKYDDMGTRQLTAALASRDDLTELENVLVDRLIRMIAGYEDDQALDRPAATMPAATMPEANALGLLPLRDVCPLLGMTFVVARRKYAQGTLPVMAFRLSASRKGPLFVHRDDLEKVVNRRRRGSPAA